MHTQKPNASCFLYTYMNSLFSQRLLPIEGANDLFFQPPPLTPTSKVYTIRPYFAKDEVTRLASCSYIFFWGSMDHVDQATCFLYLSQRRTSELNLLTMQEGMWLTWGKFVVTKLSDLFQLLYNANHWHP